MVIATCVEACPAHLIRRRTVTNATGIPKGTIMKLTDGNVAIASSGDTDPFAGIALEEKTASDGVVEISCACGGKWSMASTAAAVTCGQLVNIGAANAVLVADEAAIVAGSVVGKSVTTVGGGGGTLIVEVGEY
jgi:hypothetical protein